MCGWRIWSPVSSRRSMPKRPGRNRLSAGLAMALTLPPKALSRRILGHGRLAQLVEHLVYTERVGGSSPSPPTIFLFADVRNRLDKPRKSVIFRG